MSVKKAVLAVMISLIASPAFADWGFLPVLDSGYKADPIVSVKGGVMMPKTTGIDSLTVYGAEVNFACPLLSAPVPVRQQVSFNTGKDSGKDFQLTTIELNPHFMFAVADGLSVGVGPGFGLTMVNAAGSTNDKNLLALQAGASLQYLMGSAYLGLEARYQYTEQVEFGADKGMNNTLFAGKVGYHF